MGSILSCRIHVHLEPQKEIFFRNRVFVDVISSDEFILVKGSAEIP